MSNRFHEGKGTTAKSFTIYLTVPFASHYFFSTQSTFLSSSPSFPLPYSAPRNQLPLPITHTFLPLFLFPSHPNISFYSLPLQAIITSLPLSSSPFSLISHTRAEFPDLLQHYSSPVDPVNPHATI